MPEKTLFDGAMTKPEGFFSRMRTGFAAILEPGSGQPGEVPEDAPVHFEMVRETGVLDRLGRELAFALAELRRDPAGFASAAFSPDVTDPDQVRTRRAAYVLTLAVPFLAAVAFAIGVIIYMLIGMAQPDTVVAETEDDEKLIQVAQAPDMPDIKKQQQRAGGGGGGGKKEPTPPSKGKPPTPSLAPPVLAPTTKPTPKPPSLAMMPTVQVDPKLLPKNLDPNSLGDPKGIDGPPSDGPGEGNGIGTGKGGGVGSGDGTGVGPGRGFNMGGGDPALGGGDGEAARRVVSKVQILNNPRPQYTEIARQNKTQGKVVVKVLFGANGRVKQASVVRGLPDGLNEKAIQAVHLFSFVPAKNGAGQPVDQWQTVTVNFTIR
jgi:TonB family protein